MNFLAIAVAVVVAFVLSSVYYSVFGAKLLPAPEAGAPARPAPWQILLELCRSLIIALVLAGLADRLGITGVGGSLILAAVLWVGFPFVLLTGSMLWDKVPWRTAVSHGGDWLLKLLVVATIVGVWR